MTVGTSKRRFAIWAITRFVLSPSVAATNASASAMPASSSASISSAGADRVAAAEILPGLVEPDLEARVRLGVLVEARHRVALLEHGPGDRGADPPDADDEDEHAWGY